MTNINIRSLSNVGPTSGGITKVKVKKTSQINNRQMQVEDLQGTTINKYQQTEAMKP